MTAELISNLQVKIKAIENEISQTVSRHHGLLGLLQGTKEALSATMTVMGIIAPTSEASTIIEGISDAVNVIDDSTTNPVPQTSSSSTEDVPQ